jgi:PAS domain S-box-containing protein
MTASEGERAPLSHPGILAAALGGAPVVVFSVTADLVVEQLEGAGLAATGIDPASLVGRRIDDPSTPMTQIAPAMRAVFDDGQSAGLVNFGGRVFEYRATLNHDGSHPRAVGLATDVTDREDAIASTGQARRLFADIAGRLSVPVLISRIEDGRVLYANVALAQMFGTSVGELIGRVTPDFYADERDRAKLVSAVRAQGLVHDYELRVKTASGEPFWVSASIQPFAFEGSPSLLAGFYDITKRKQAEEALQAQDEQWRSLVSGSPDYILRLDRDGVIRFANRPRPGLTLEEVVGVPLLDFVHPSWRDAMRRALDAVWRTGEPQRAEIEATSDVGTYWYLARLMPIRTDGTVSGVTVIATDVTDSKQAEVASRLKAEAQIQQLQKIEAVGLLAGGIAHDFNNLMTAVLVYSETLMDALDEGSHLHRVADEIHKAGSRAVALTGQLLAFSRRQVLQPRVVVLASVIDEMRTMLQTLLGGGIRIAIHDDGERRAVLADPNQLQQVVMNLAVNARDAMPDGGTLTLMIDGHTLSDIEAPRLGVSPGPHVRLRVRDTGTGMDTVTKGRLFEPFFTTKDKTKGTGLGLSTVLGIVSQSGGAISVDSEPGHGAEFTIYLAQTNQPATRFPRPSDSIRVGRHTAQDRDRARGTETLLIAEDEPIVLDLAAAGLQALGYHVITAEDGDAALAIAEHYEGEIHVLISDVMMPHMRGPELAQRLRAQRPGIKVLFISGYPEDAAIASDAGTRYLPKPFTQPVLASAVRELLAGD